MKTFYLPDLGEGLPDAEIREWLIKEGDTVKVDQPIVSMETAKALVDVPSPYNGRISKLCGQPGDIIKTGNPLVEYESAAGEVQAAQKPQEDAGTVVGSIEVGDRILKEAPTGIQPSNATKGNIRVTPAVRALAKELNVELEKVTPTGPGSTVTVQDIKNAANQSDVLQEGYETLHGVKRSMAINMALAHASVVPVTIVDDADIQHFAKEEDITLRLIRAIVAACRAQPELNAHLDGKNLSRRVFNEINLALAVDTPKGLYAPVIKSADTLSPADLRAAINSLKEQAKQQEFKKELLQGATITLSNFGTFVGRYASPIVLPPSVAIVGIGRSRDEVVAFEGKPAIHRIMPVSLTFDHRAVTGGEAARFLAAFIADLES
jgi:2-oxoisovalerate dehydrogenase E2 component (dihydrolipoyl transacylase)